MSKRARLAELLGRYVEHHVLHGARLAPEDLCEGDVELVKPLRERIRQYEQLQDTLVDPVVEPQRETSRADEALPVFEGFRTIERIGSGGGGEVYKLEDLELGRTVAAKVIRRDNPLRTTLDDFLREARVLALFEDPRVVGIFGFRSQADPPVLFMEYVEGFELNRIARSLEYNQRARLMVEICEAIHHAHGLGIQHRDLKPANILVDAKLSPKILDFGLSRGDPDRGHGVGTPAYMAPEQLDPVRPIDDRTDVYALGVILYEILCGSLPYQAESATDLISVIRQGQPPLPVEVEPDVPEPLQAIALRAMEPDPALRYASAREIAQDLRRYLGNRPVLARPSLYHAALERRVQPHLQQVREWQRLKLIYPHEADRLKRAYRDLEVRDDDWIVRSRSLSFSQISLYLGAFLMLCGGLLYFTAYVYEAVQGWLRPTLILGLPCVGLNAAAFRFYRRGRQAVAVAFYLGAVTLLPLFILIFLQEAGFWNVDPERASELLGWLGEGAPSNRQLQVAGFAACLWSCLLALGTRTVTLSSSFTVFAVGFNLSVLADFGLREWLEEGEFDLLALHLLPLFLVVIALGLTAERRGRPWFARPLYIAAAALYVLVLELLALQGKAFAHLGLSTVPLAGEGDPVLLDTLAAMIVNGVLIYLGGRLLDKYGSELMATPSWLLYSLSPFAMLEPIAFLNGVGDYSERYAWFYLGLSLLIAFLSHFRQRKSFYYAGLINTGAALWYVTDLYDWWERPLWAIVVLGIGLVILAGGFMLHVRERNRRTIQ